MDRNVQRNRSLLRARDAMDRRYAEPLDVPALAAVAGVSAAHFSRTFREVFGETPHRYLQRRRVERTNLLHDGLDPAEQFRRSAHRPADAKVGPETKGALTMITSIKISSIYVFDQDEAVDFYVNKLGLEMSADLDFGPMRWLTVRVPGDPSRDILIEKVAPPSLSADNAAKMKELIAAGATGFAAGFTTDDIHSTYRELQTKDVEITQEPVEQSYGTDIALRDPFGNHIRITQMAN